MRKRARSSGFSLIELLISMSLSTFILLGIISVSASMVRFQFEGVRKGQATSQSLYALHRMHREIESATFLNLPAPPGPTSGDVLAGCTNWSANLAPLGNKYDASADVVSFYYCLTSSTHATFPNSLMRYERINGGPPACPFSPVPSPCGNAAAGATREAVVYNNLYKLEGYANLFYRGSSERSLTVAYIVGYATPTVNVPIPVAYKVNTNFHLNKSMLNTVD